MDRPLLFAGEVEAGLLFLGMDIRESLLERYNKEQVVGIAQWIGADEERFAILVDLMLARDEKVSPRAAWAMSHCLDLHPTLIEPHLSIFVKLLRDRSLSDAVRRNILRALQSVDLPEEYWGEVADVCFSQAADPQEVVAVRVFSLTIAWNICQKVPELKDELKLIIEDQWDHATAGFRSRGRKILKRIEKDSRKS